MFERLGRFVSRTWQLLLTAWVLLFAVLMVVAPKWESVVRDGEFRYLPSDVPSHQAELLFQKAFSKRLESSSIVVVARRESAEGLLDEDKTYIDETLVPQIERAAGQIGAAADQADANREGTSGAAAAAKSGAASEKRPAAGDEKSAAPGKSAQSTAAADKTAVGKPAPDPSSTAAAGSEAGGAAQDSRPVVAKIRTFSDKEFGQLLISEDNKATLIMLELTTEFMEQRNRPLIEQLEKLIGTHGQVGTLQLDKNFPRGLDLSLSGSATVGRDMREAARQSAKATEAATLVLVVLLLFCIYRAPILAVIPLLTVFISVKIAILVLSIMADHGLVRLFSGIEVYVTVVLYGAGVDYCMFLMARYKEELDGGATFDEAVEISVTRVGHALAASAATVMCGIGMMIFTRFGKFQDAGVAMSFSLIFVLAASLTLTPALLRLCGRWTFWPRVPTERLAKAQGWISPTNVISRLLEREWFGKVWDKIGAVLLVRPGTIWLTAILLMTPFAILAIMWQHKLSYGLLSELPRSDSSVVGSAAVQAHFPAGITGPITMLVANRNADFRSDAGDEAENRPGKDAIRDFVDALYDHRDELGIADIRSAAYPLGMSDRVRSGTIAHGIRLKRSQSVYISDQPGFAGQVTWIDVILSNDPFSPDSMEQYDRLNEAAPRFLPPALQRSTELQYLGATPSIRDLKTVTANDQVRINFLVPAVVFLILVILLRRIATSAYLIFTVFFSYFVTLGVTFVVFYLASRHGFAGLDWKVPMFLFTILVAVGEDYNILLMTRIEEEQTAHGPVQGVIFGLRKTGSIISSCGIIMAGTFSALMAGTLQGLAQLGFALAFGVLLDTFVVRPILVPAYLILLHQGWFGSLGRYLGADPRLSRQKPQPIAIGSDGRDG